MSLLVQLPDDAAGDQGAYKTPAMEPRLLNESWAFDHRVLEEEILVDFDANARLF